MSILIIKSERDNLRRVTCLASVLTRPDWRAGGLSPALSDSSRGNVFLETVEELISAFQRRELTGLFIYI